MSRSEGACTLSGGTSPVFVGDGTVVWYFILARAWTGELPASQAQEHIKLRFKT